MVGCEDSSLFLLSLQKKASRHCAGGPYPTKQKVYLLRNVDDKTKSAASSCQTQGVYASERVERAESGRYQAHEKLPLNDKETIPVTQAVI